MGANAQTSVPLFTAGQILTAANQNLSAGTGVPVFASTTTRDAAFGGTGEKVLAEGQLCYVEGTGLQTYNGSSWVTWGTRNGIIQVKSAFKTTPFTTTSTAFVDVTDVSISITPTSSSNSVFVLCTGIFSCTNAGAAGRMNLVRGSTAIGQSTGGTGNQTAGPFTESASSGDLFALSVVDSPATTSATTYKLQVAALGISTVGIGRYAVDAAYPSITTITVMEVTP